ncbi:Sulfite reductase [NADPH] subunit beta [Smittium culicis]|uniref:assimilatory sulfite reductase (NADPH) n=1 Tax=Smittium culicis TaxID=133412 RepID=A0A1R1XTE9_9FUNG|nr:Sulfite reductase [NADPH] subunit beta [Smittium culicis]
MSIDSNSFSSFSALGLSAINASDIVIIEDISVFSDTISTIELKAQTNSAPALIKVEPYSDLSKIVEKVIDSLKSNTNISIFVSSSIILQLLPLFSRLFHPSNTHKDTDPNISISLNVSIGSTGSESITSSNVFAFSDLNCPIISSSSPQECYDNLQISTAASHILRTPVINYFDSDFLKNQAISNINTSENVSSITTNYLEKYNKIIESIEPEADAMEVDGQPEDNEQSNKVTLTTSEALNLVFESTVSQNKSVTYTGPASPKNVFVSISDYKISKLVGDANSGYLTINTYRPFPAESIASALPKSTENLILLEQIDNPARLWGNLVFDFTLLTQTKEFSSGRTTRPSLIDVQSKSSIPLTLSNPQHFNKLISKIETINSSQIISLDDILELKPSSNVSDKSTSSKKPDDRLSEIEISSRLPYQQILHTAFESRLNIVNSSDPKTIWGDSSYIETNPEYGFGIVLSDEQKRQTLYKSVLDYLAEKPSETDSELREILHKWVNSYNSNFNSNQLFQDNISNLISNEISASGDRPSLNAISSLSEYLDRHSNWIIGSDEWAVDIGNSGVHHVISSNLNINMLVIDTSDYSEDSDSSISANKILQKKDVGLYAMNYGGAYVASVSAYSSYTQSLTALIEADAFPGPSVVIAHLPHSNKKLISPSYSSIETMRLSKLAVDSGKWPLYRYKPSDNNDSSFVLDSSKLKNEIQKFLDRNNTLSIISQSTPKFYSGVEESLESQKAKKAAQAAKEDLERLMAGLQGPSITVLYASDAHNAEEVARRVHRGARLRNLNSEISVLDDFDFDELEFKTTIIFIVSTAGQGEFPSNGRNFWKSLGVASVNLSNLKYSVFGLGDSHYWPREEDRIFFNKPAKDLDKRLAELSAIRLTDLGLGDDQDPEGWESGYEKWVPGLWSSLGLDIDIDSNVVFDDEPPKISDEDNKINSNYLRGNIVSELEDSSKGDVDEFTGKLLKFHGTYGQDDRDIRPSRIDAGLSPAYSFMIRVRLPGGRTTTEQWLAMDDLSTKYGNETMKITTRQTFQLHGVLKSNLRTTINLINKSLLDTIAACGDVNRNVVASANPLQQHLRKEVFETAKLISDELLPKSSAFHEIWVADKMVAGQAVQDFEPIYGKAYLPRKFKIAIAIPPENDVDVFAYDLGLIAILDENENITGYNVAIGGGMGMTHNNKKTYPRVATVIGYITKDQVVDVCKAIVCVQRDFGDRKNRKHARMKYTVDDHGVEWFKNQIETVSGLTFEEIRPYKFNRNGDRYGWVDSTPGFKNYTMFIQNGRVADIPGYQLKSALRTIAKAHKGFFQLTCNSHLIIADVPDSEVDQMDALLRKLNVHNKSHSAMRLNSMACTSLPTCGLAMAESERYLPSLVSLIENVLDESGLRNDAIVIRMTGCPNGCARPYIAEIALVGKAPGTYNLYLGGAFDGSRLNKIYKESVNEEQILHALKPIIKNYALDRLDGESFGDYVIRAGVVKETFQGLDFHD